MSETLDPVATTDLDHRQLAEQLLAQAKEQGVDLVGPNGLLNQLTKNVLETALDAEMTEHLGYDKHDPAGRGSGNSRNGVRSKTVLTEIGPVDIDVPRDVNSSFDPQIVKKRQRRLTGIDEIVLSLTAKGLTTGEIAAHFQDIYGATVSKDTISRITDKVVAEMAEWCNRPLEPAYPVVFIDAIHVKIRDGQVTNRPVYVAIGVTCGGERDILGLWAGDGGEGAKFWLAVLTEIKNRGTGDVCIVVCDGLKGLPDAITTVWDRAIVQTCVIHLLRNTFRYASRKYWDQISKEIRPVYTAPTEAAAKERFVEFAATWGAQYPAIIRLWENAWSEFVPFLDYGACCRIACRQHIWRRWLGKCGVAKSYRPVLRDQPMLLPVDLHEWLPPDHLVWFVLETVEVLDTSGLEQLTRRRGGAGAAGYDPRMLLALLIYAYCQGVRSSRQIERMCVTDVAFRVLCAQDGPDHVTIARFRCEARDVFTDLFSQVLMIAAGAGLGRFGTVAIDGTKIAANASIDANHGKQWFDQRTTELIVEAEDTDRDEDTTAAGAVDAGQDRVPAELGDRTRRAERIRQGAQELKAELARRARGDEDRHAAAAARRQRSEHGEPVVGRIPNGPHRLPEARAHLAREVAAHQAKLDRYATLIAEGRKPMGRPPVAMEDSTRVQRARRVVRHAETAERVTVQTDGQSISDAKRLPKVVVNVTDPQSRIMPTRKGFLQGYNAQVAVTGDQLIIAVRVGQSTNDQASFLPMMQAAHDTAARIHAVTGNADHLIGTVLADAGYNSEANLAAAGPDRLIALGKERDQARAFTQDPVEGPPPPDATPREANRHRLRTLEGRALYKRRGATVEPGIGNLKKIIDRFSRRGLDNATHELHLAATAFNIKKIHRATAAA